MIDYRAEVRRLPEPLRAELLALLDADDHRSVAQAVEEDLEAGAPRTQEKLVVLACAIFLDAYEIFVDRIIAASRRALSLLREAESLGLDPARGRVLSSEIEAVLRETEARESAELALAERSQEAGELSAKTVAARAHRTWESGDAAGAASLFLEAARLEEQAAAARSRWAAPDQSMNYLVRAGRCFFESGDYASAIPLLERAIAFDWRAARLWADRHTTEWAFVCLLEDCARRADFSGFQALWERALQRGEELEFPFPTIHPLQERLLEICLVHRLLHYLPRIVAMIEARESRLPKALRSRIAAARAELDGAPEA